MAKRVGVFVDISNLYYCVGKKFNGKINYSKYLSAAIGSNELYGAFAYGAQMGNESDRFLECLRTCGYVPKYKQPKIYDNSKYHIDLDPLSRLIQVAEGDPENNALIKEAMTAIDKVKALLFTKKDTRKADWDVGIAMDVVRLINKIDVVVLGSADGDLAPLLKWSQDQSCYTIVLACQVSRELKETADEVIEIDESLLDSAPFVRPRRSQ